MKVRGLRLFFFKTKRIPLILTPLKLLNMDSISIEKLKNEDTGRLVIFNDGHNTEEGTISSWNGRYIFVKFRSSNTAQACKPELLKFTAL